MHGVEILRDLVILAGVAIPVVALAHRFGIPPIAGFLTAGVAAGSCSREGVFRYWKLSPSSPPSPSRSASSFGEGSPTGRS